MVAVDENHFGQSVGQAHGFVGKMSHGTAIRQGHFKSFAGHSGREELFESHVDFDLHGKHSNFPFRYRYARCPITVLGFRACSRNLF